jgi:Tol biopolymer transport system component
LPEEIAKLPGATSRGQRSDIEEASVAERFARRLIDVGDGLLTLPRWAPDGRQFLFTWNHDPPRPGQLMISTASGQMSPLDPQAPGRTAEGIWSADGQYVIYPRMIDGQRTEVARIRPGSTAAPEILATYPFREAARVRRPMAASPTGEWILARSDEQRLTYFLMSPDFKSERPLASRRLGNAAGFSKDGRDVIGFFQDTSAERAQWQLWVVDVATGRERRLTNVDLPLGTENVVSFSLHPDGTRLLTNAGGLKTDIWMLKGFDRR